MRYSGYTYSEIRKRSCAEIKKFGINALNIKVGYGYRLCDIITSSLDKSDCIPHYVWLLGAHIMSFFFNMHR